MTGGMHARRHSKTELMNETQELLEDELTNIKYNLDLVSGLRVSWMPNVNTTLSGEIKGNVIFIYERDTKRALETLRHEVIDYCVSQAIEPYKEVTNKMIKLLNEYAYKQKEKVVEELIRLINNQETESLY